MASPMKLPFLTSSYHPILSIAYLKFANPFVPCTKVYESPKAYIYLMESHLKETGRLLAFAPEQRMKTQDTRNKGVMMGSQM